MEDIFTHIIASASKNKAVRSACNSACDTLEAQGSTSEKYKLRMICLIPLKLALESKNSKLTTLALDGIQKVVEEETFKSDEATEELEQTVFMQVLWSLSGTPSLNEETQVDVMKFLVTLSSSDACPLHSAYVNALIELCTNTFKNNPQMSVRTAVKVTLTQTLSHVCQFLQDRHNSKVKMKEDVADVIAEFSSKGPTASLCQDINKVLEFLCERLSEDQKLNNNQQKQPVLTMLLEAILSMLTNSSKELGNDSNFNKIVWQKLCPTLIAILGIPKDDKDLVSTSQENDATSVPDQGRGSTYSTTSSAVTPSSRVIYSIAAELVRLVGNVESLRPVLGSLFHRILLYPPPVQRNEAIKVIKEMLSNPARVLDMAGPPLHDVKGSKSSLNDGSRERNPDLDLLKLLLDGVADSSHCKDSAVCHSGVVCVLGFLTSLEEISQGKHLSKYQIEEINKMKEIVIERAPSTEPTPKIIEIVRQSESAKESKEPGKEFMCVEMAGQKIDKPGKPSDTWLVVEDDGQKKEEKEESNHVGDESNEHIEKVILDEKKDHGDVPNDITESPVKDSTEIVESVYLDDEDNIENVKSSEQEEELNGLTDGDDADDEDEDDDEDVIDEPKLTELDERQLKRRQEMERLAERNEEEERNGARQYIEALIKLLPSIIAEGDPKVVDEMLLEFASTFVGNYTAKRQQSVQEKGSNNSSPTKKLNLTPVINADGIYVATYYALLLNLKLLKSGHYGSEECKLPMNKQQFVNKVHDSGILIYLSSTWLGELYNQLLKKNVLGLAGYKPELVQCNKALITLLTEIDGLTSREIGGQMMHDATSPSKVVLHIVSNSPDQASEAGMKFTRGVLVTMWDQILTVLAAPLTMRGITGIGSIAFLLGTEGAKEQNSRDRDSICMSLDALRKAAGLSCLLGLQDRCAAVFAHLANASCVSEDVPQPTGEQGKKGARKNSNKGGIRLHAAHVMNMDALLSMGLEMGSHAASCWKHVFRCCAYVAQLEHSHFSRNSSHQPSISLPKLSDHQEHHDGYDDDDLMTPYSQMAVPPPMRAPVNVQDIIQQNSQESGFEMNSARGGILTVSNAAKAVYALSSDVDRLFEEAAANLNLKALLGFLRELRAASQLQLFSSTAKDDEFSIISPTSPSKSLQTTGYSSTSLHLFKMADVMLRCSRSRSRPLLHVMQAWNIVAPHFVEVACHKDRHVSKKAIASIHDVLTELLTDKSELPHFNFNESLFKPFESLLRLELCDEDVQDQVVTSICEIVEESYTNIKSGWRPLFGTLRAVRVHRQKFENMDDTGYGDSSERTEHPSAPVFDVFEAFLNTENVAVFSNAAIDCILCLLKFVKGPGTVMYAVVKPLTSKDPEDSVFVDTVEPEVNSNTSSYSVGTTLQAVDLCLPSLDYLHRCHKILSSIYNMPTSPSFRGSQSIKMSTKGLSPPSESPIQELGSSETFVVIDSKVMYSPEELDLLKPVCVESIDDDSGIIRVWFLLLEGLTGSVTTCPRHYQPQTLELLFEIIRSVNQTPGPQFAVYSVSHLLLPMLQSWVRRGRQAPSFWDTSIANFKHACGLTTDLIVDLISHFVKNNSSLDGVYLMIKQLLDLLVECIGQTTEAVSRLGCSCIRHMLLSAGPILTHEMWTFACKGMQQAVETSLHSLKRLMACFHPGSDDFMGDVGQVKVAARRDIKPMDYFRLQHLAQQVFLLECQRIPNFDVNEEASRSFIFILYPPDVDTTMKLDLIHTRVHYRNIVLGLLAHQLLIQTLGTILLYGAQSQTSNEQQVIAKGSMSSTLGLHDSVNGSGSASNGESFLPGLLPYLSPKNLSLLLECFVDSYQTACEFNNRPGMKFLLQKVAKLDVAVNMYYQAGMSFTFYSHTLLELCHHANKANLNSDLVKAIIKDMSHRLKHVSDVPYQEIESTDVIPQNDGTEKSSEEVPEVKNEPDEVKPVLRARSRSTASNSSEQSSQHPCPSIKSSMESLHMNCDLSFFPSEDKTDYDWVVKRLYGICNDIIASYLQFNTDKDTEVTNKEEEVPLFFLVAPKSPEPSSVSDPFFHSYDDEPKRNFAMSQWTPKIKHGDEQELSHEAHAENNDEPASPKESGKIYTVATTKTIKSLMQEYKKRKTQHSRSVFVKKPTYKEWKYTHQSKPKIEGMTSDDRRKQEKIKQEQKSSIMRDHDALLKSWSDMILSMMQLLQLLPDTQFQSILPIVFPSINQLVCHVKNDTVRQAVMEFMERIAHLYCVV
ncbi:brefeldin A-inhibited guanine nucleotide-exchange protein 3-like isoform X2 [Anneissia japonica]|uniref:brefeldin A-inhibited guanine nucleotide-exchange protein 3-like isoform X2 n=1 Tax=Anneissia japonica TaxID=1529436 RepID=UPI0014255F9F|nr:brefeldin A-inhibited guanine nucleotide-exchange protein 3-like isoform X2 [Anneissia japonica]